MPKLGTPPVDDAKTSLKAEHQNLVTNVAGLMEDSQAQKSFSTQLMDMLKKMQGSICDLQVRPKRKKPTYSPKHLTGGKHHDNKPNTTTTNITCSFTTNP